MMNDWIEWNGGECPVPDGVLVSVKFSSGAVASETFGTDWHWMRQGERGDIVAYRILGD